MDWTMEKSLKKSLENKLEQLSVFWQNLEFHGVMRFYFEDHVGGNVATKCLHVCSNSSTQEVIETLSEKFRPDMKMLTTSYSLYEIHGNKGNHSTRMTQGEKKSGFFASLMGHRVIKLG